MEEKLEKILLDLNIGYITVKVAKRKILRLFAVSGQSEQLVCICKNRQDQFKRGDIWICGDCEKEIKQTNCH